MFNFINYIKTLLGIYNDSEIKGYYQTSKQFLVKISLFTSFTFLILINNVFFLLDEVLLFFYRFTPIEKPIMIIGLPRTGTTLLYRTLAADKDNFTCFTFAEIIFAPSLIQKYLFYAIYRLDKLVGAPLKKGLRLLESKSKMDYAKIHNFGYLKPEEDEFLLINIYSSIILKYFFPRSKVFDKYIAFDEKVSPFEKRNIFNFQKRCVQKHLFFWKSIHGKQKIFLSKNPIYTPKINTLFQFYPDMRVIITNRNLDEVIPSFISMNATILKSIHSHKLTYPNYDIARNVIISWHTQLLSKISKKDPSVVYECKYELLTASVKEMVCLIYKHFGLCITETYLNELNRGLANQKYYRSSHKIDFAELEKTLAKS